MSAQTATYDPSTHVATSKLTLHLLKREANINERPLARHLVSTAKYLGIGALVHAWLLGGMFAPESMWSWGYLLAWPVPPAFWLLSWVGLYLLYALGVVVLASLIWWGTVELLDWRDRRRRARTRGGRFV